MHSRVMDTKKMSWARFLVTFLSVMVVLVSVSQAADEKMTAAKIPHVGFLAPQGRSLPLFGAFREGLAGLGYIEGRNVVIEPRFAEGQSERLPDLAAELVRLKVVSLS